MVTEYMICTDILHSDKTAICLENLNKLGVGSDYKTGGAERDWDVPSMAGGSEAFQWIAREKFIIDAAEGCQWPTEISQGHCQRFSNMQDVD